MRLLAISFAFALFGCQAILGIEDTRVGAGGDGGADPDAPGSGDAGSDGNVPVSCTPSSSECDNCMDDDQDGKIDGADLHCTTRADDDEASFSTEIPGDNIDSMKFDCFFDGDSGSGVDGCDVHPCCSLGAPDQASCPINPSGYDPLDCDLTQTCIDNCGPVVIPGCDCLGCCTVCDDTGNCFDVQVHPLASPSCTDQFSDSSECLSCTKKPECALECDAASCILCPGQTVDDLPAPCGGVPVCPGMSTSCELSSDCSAGEFCANGCCIPQSM